jgi:hypothetical protein
VSWPPCDEGIGFYVGATPILVSDIQMKKILSTSKFSARPIQQIGRHAFGSADGVSLSDSSGSSAEARLGQLIEKIFGHRFVKQADLK